MFPTITYFFSFVKIFLTKFQVSKFQKLRSALIGSPWDNFRQSRLCIKAVPLPSLPDIPASYSPENRRRSYGRSPLYCGWMRSADRWKERPSQNNRDEEKAETRSLHELLWLLPSSAYGSDWQWWFLLLWNHLPERSSTG